MCNCLKKVKYGFIQHPRESNNYPAGGKNGFVSFYCLKFNLAPANKEYKVCVVCERETERHKEREREREGGEAACLF